MTTLALPTLLTHDQATACAQSLGLEIRTKKSDVICIDASALEKFDSSALAVLLQCRRDAATTGKSFAVTDLPHQLLELADLYGISELFEKHQGKA